LQEVVRRNEAEDYAHEKREPFPRRVMYDHWRRKFIQRASGLESATASREYISDPPAISSISERDQKSVWLAKHIYGCPVALAGPSAHVCNDGEARQSGGKSDRKSVRNRSMKHCHAPLAESDQKNGSEQDCEN
jgi:hypothetical protein